MKPANRLPSSALGRLPLLQAAGATFHAALSLRNPPVETHWCQLSDPVSGRLARARAVRPSGLGYTIVFSVLCGFGLAVSSVCSAETNAIPPAPRYETRAQHDPDGIGKFYLGREIADVMGHEAADWLERPERQREERTDLLIPLLKLKPGDNVADIGAGTGYYTRLLAKAVEANLPTGKPGLVYAEDIQPEMLGILTNKMAAAGLGNVRPVLGTLTDPKLPAGSLDLILLVDVYHEFDHPFEMAEAMCRALKPGGRMVFVEFRGEDPAVAIKRVHKMTEAQVRKEMAMQPLAWVETIRALPQQHIIVFRKKIRGNE